VADETAPSDGKGRSAVPAVPVMTTEVPATGAPVRQSGSARWGQPVYAIGRLSPQFGSIGVEKEFAQATEGRLQSDQLDVGALRWVLDNPEDAYLGRHLCWVFTCQGVDTFTVMPRDDVDVTRLAKALSATEDVMHAIVGKTIPSPNDSPCAATGLPTVQADQVLAFTLKEFAGKLLDSRASTTEASSAEESEADRAEFEAIVRGVLLRLTRGTASPGFTEEDRARNYVAMRYPAIYHAVSLAQLDGKVLVGVDAQHSHSAVRRLVTVRLILRDPRTDITERYQCQVDVTELFPFLVTGLQPAYE
jgi:hypothetical protein